MTLSTIVFWSKWEQFFFFSQFLVNILDTLDPIHGNNFIYYIIISYINLNPFKIAANDAELPNYYSTLEMIGDAAFDQRLYTIAAKKYTEANNRIKVLINS